MNELQHHGVKGMKWGVRKARKHAGPGVRIGSDKRKLAGAKRDLARLDRGEHLSVGATKKRQAQYDARDRKALNKKIAKLEAKKTKDVPKQTVAERGRKVIQKAVTAYSGYKVWQLTDDLLTGGKQQAVVNAVIKDVGRFAISAYYYAKGARDIRWYDN